MDAVLSVASSPSRRSNAAYHRMDERSGTVNFDRLARMDYSPTEQRKYGVVAPEELEDPDYLDETNRRESVSDMSDASKSTYLHYIYYTSYYFLFIY